MNEKPLDEPVAEIELDPAIVKPLAHAMEVVAKVAKLYKKHRKPPTWYKRVQTLDGGKWEPTDEAPDGKPNRAMRRLQTLPIRRQIARAKVQRFTCGTCNKSFIGANRCQCKTAPPLATQKRHEVEWKLQQAATDLLINGNAETEAA